MFDYTSHQREPDIPPPNPFVEAWTIHHTDYQTLKDHTRQQTHEGITAN